MPDWMFLELSCTIEHMEKQDWERLGSRVVDRRVALGMRTREALADTSGLSSRLLGDIEKGRRESYSPGTFAVLEQALQWTSGSVSEILRGGEPGYVDNLAGVTSHGEELFFLQDMSQPTGSSRSDEDFTAKPEKALRERFSTLFPSYTSGQLSATLLQELADEAWIRERLHVLSVEQRQAVKDFINHLGRDAFANWDRMFPEAGVTASKEHVEPKIYPRPSDGESQKPHPGDEGSPA